jgi:CRP-like cAMP-binding protein
MQTSNWPWRLSEKAQEKLQAKTQNLKLQSGAVVYDEGETSDMVFKVLSGQIKVFKTTKTGQEIPLYFIEAGQVCPLALQSCLMWKPAMASAVTTEETEIACIPAADFAQMLTIQEEALNDILNFVGENLKAIEEAFRSVSQNRSTKLN